MKLSTLDWAIALFCLLIGLACGVLAATLVELLAHAH